MKDKLPNTHTSAAVQRPSAHAAIQTKAAGKGNRLLTSIVYADMQPIVDGKITPKFNKHHFWEHS